MEEGVRNADVFICCLTDGYLHSAACQKEFSFAQKHHKPVLPLLLEGYGGDGGSVPPWPPANTQMADAPPQVWQRPRWAMSVASEARLPVGC